MRNPQLYSLGAQQLREGDSQVPVLLVQRRRVIVEAVRIAIERIMPENAHLILPDTVTIAVSKREIMILRVVVI